MIAANRIAAVKPVCSACPRCDDFIGPALEIVLCGRRRISLVNGTCPQRYWDARDLTAMPSITAERPVASRLPGPGDLVKGVLERMGVTARPGCGCGRMRRQMNRWGWIACATTRRSQIVEWFSAKAKEQGLNVADETIGTMLNRLWKTHA